MDEATSFDGFTSFIYVIRESDGRKDHSNLSSGIMFARCKSVSILDVKHFDEDNHRFYNSPRVAVTSCVLVYCDKHENNKYGRAT